MKCKLANINFFVLLILVMIAPIKMSANTIQEPIEVTEVQEIKEAGTYPVIIRSTINGVETEKIIYITINFPHTVISETYQEAIDALDIKGKKGELENYSDSQLISLAKAHAWNTKDGSELPITQVTKEKIADDIYHVRFGTALGTTAEINMIGYDSVISKYDYTIIQEQNMTVAIGESVQNITIVLGGIVIIPFILLFILFINISKQNQDVLDIFIEKSSKK